MTMVPFWLLPGGREGKRMQQTRRFVGYDFSLARREARRVHVGAKSS